MEQELIDLTEDGDIKNEPVSELKTDVSEKKRKFPLTIAHTHPPVPVHEHHHQLKQPPRNPYESNMHARDMYYAQHSLEAACRNLTIDFSLLNPKEFTARAELGPIPGIVIDTLKLCPGVRFEYNLKRWQFPLMHHDRLLASLRKLGCGVEPIPRHVMVAATIYRPQSTADENIANDLKEGGLDETVLQNLAPFQREAVRFITSKNGRALVADEMGLGKTRTAIAAACFYQQEWPVLILCPSSARHHWQQELLNVVPESLLEPRQITVVDNGHHPLQRSNDAFDYKFVIISYNLAVTKAPLLVPFNFQVIIADESHYLKTRQSKRTKVLVPMIQRAKRAILLSGTPALSRPLELFSQLQALDSLKWNDLKEFGKRYCRDARPSSKKSLFNSHNRFTWGDNGYKGANNTTELHFILSATVMIRRLKKDILQQLPPKNRYLVKIDINDNETRSRFMQMLATLSKYEELLSKKKAKSTSKLSLSLKSSSEQTLESQETMSDILSSKKQVLLELFNESGSAKLPAVLSYIDTYLVKDSSGKILVFAHHKAVIDGLCNFFREKNLKYIKIDGSTSSKDRHVYTQRFQSDPDLRVAVLGITAAGIALTLTAANVVFFTEMFWTPGSLIQAEDRAHRIGQIKEVKVFYFFAENSVDELLWPLVRKKMKLFGQFIEGRFNADMGASLLKQQPGIKSSSQPQEESSEGNDTGNETRDMGMVETIIGNVEEFEVIAQELAHEEERMDILVQPGASNRKRKSNVDGEGDDEDEVDEKGAESDNDYEEYLNQPEKPDALALEYVRQYEAYMAQQELIRQNQFEKGKIQIIEIPDDDDPKPHIATTMKSDQLSETIELIELIDSDDDAVGTHVASSRKFENAQQNKDDFDAQRIILVANDAMDSVQIEKEHDTAITQFIL